MRELAQDLWIFEGDTVSFYGMPYSTRMTVARLPSGELWVHSPIHISDELAAELDELDELGQVRYLIAPNHLHHLFIPRWQKKYPDAALFGTREVIKKRADIYFDQELMTGDDYPWSQEIAQRLFTGSQWMEECLFFHKPSRTLIVTDWIENFSPQHFNLWQRWIARGVGILAPKGKMPLDWRLSFLRQKPMAREHLKRVMAWNPDRIVMAHGKIVESEASEFLTRSFHWLIH